MAGPLAASFWELLCVPFQHVELIWGIVPLYFSWMVTELTTSKPSYQTAIQTGFALLWAGAQWVWQAGVVASRTPSGWNHLHLVSLNSLVTLVVLALGGLALWSGLRHRYPHGMQFLGHTRFAGYFMITLFPIQAGRLSWTWDRAAAIAVFTIPVWALVHLLLWPLRRR